MSERDTPPALRPSPGAALLPGALTHAGTDEQLVALWLRRPNLSPRTIRNSEKEARRLLLWCRAQQLELRTVRYEHLLSYAEFLAAPSPAPDWIAPAKYPRADPRWRPFLGKLSEASQRQALVVVKGLFSWAQLAGYLPDNPAKLLGAMALEVDGEITRYLPQAAMPYILQAADALPCQSAGDRLRKARARFLVLAYYATAVRLSELVQADMRSIRPDEHGRWWLHVLGKGRRHGKVPVPAPLLDEFRRYRGYLGLPALPAHDEDLPLLLTTRGPQRRATAKTVARAVRTVMRRAAQLASDAGHAELATRIERASTHWLRHSALTHQLDNGLSLTAVQRNGRHANIKTTGRYLHKDDADRHAETSATWHLSGFK